MDKMNLQTPKGFRDFLPKDALKRKFVLEKIVKVFEKFGFDPLETPTLEYEKTLKGKYGEEEKLIYKFETPGGDKVALRYDQTVPLARVIAQYGPNGAQILPIPLKRYQIQSAYRGENTQKGRYREFLQCDADIIGVSSLVADAEILGLVYEIYKKLGLDIVLAINDRLLLEGIEPKFLSALDKLDKIGPDGVKKELIEKGLTESEAESLYLKVTQTPESENLTKIREFFVSLGYPSEALKFNPTIIRGLDYYTGMIFEVKLASGVGSSLCGGGRWDKMIGKFTGIDLPAVGFAIGFDRTLETMEEVGVLSTPPTQSKVLVTVFSMELGEESLEITNKLRKAGINTEISLDANIKLEKQLKYADQKGIPYVVIIGPDEVSKNQVTLKDLRSKTQQTLSLDQVIDTIKS